MTLGYNRSMEPARIYLDHAATTLLRPEARAAMEPFLGAAFGNPSSLHGDGQQAKRALDTARSLVADALEADFSEITFTSGGTEADNAALVGVMLAHRASGNHLVTTQIEHEAVLRTAEFLQTIGFEAAFVPPDSQGHINPYEIAAAITDCTTLVSVMHANNEVGAIQPIREIADIALARGALFHTDAVQTFGQLPINVSDLGVDLLTISGHKIYGPKGIGALYVRSGIAIEPWLHGGGQERERRAGTENTSAIVGFGEAVRLMMLERAELAARLAHLRDQFLAMLQHRIPIAMLNGHPTERLPNNINISFPGFDADAVLVRLDRAGISASSGSACASGSIEPSHVLQAMGLADARVNSAIRFTLGRSTTSGEMRRTVDVLASIFPDN